MRLIRKRLLAAAAAVAGLCIAAGPAVSASASAPTLHAAYYPTLYAAYYQEAHQCTVIGTDYWGNAGVVCADLIADPNTLGFPEARAQVEIICQNAAGAEQQCAEAHAYGALANAQTGAGYRYEFDCGHSYGPCSAGRNIWPMAGQVLHLPAPDCFTGLAANFWTVVYGQGALTSIELPGSGKWLYLGSPQANDSGNQSSGHYQVCP